ncbi:MAG: hypothetical protein Q4E26_00425 [Prevotellaceae bacterium]|nr:hypothetical protein [Prevotellaceae bacterium]
MCTFNIALDDTLVKSARQSFPDENSMTIWMEEQISVLLKMHVQAENKKSVRKAHKHDALMGIISEVSDIDAKRVHLSEKYGL